MSNVYIVGAGIHPFGRHNKTGLDQGVYAVNQAFEDAGVAWDDMQFAFGGSHAAGNADAMLPRLGLNGTQFINVANGCATGGSALLSGYWAIKSGEFEMGLVTGFDKHPRGAFAASPQNYGLPNWYAETGLMMTTQFFALKIKRYMEQFGISESSLVRVSEKAFSNGALAPHAWRRTPIDYDTIANAPMLSDPLRKYMFCSPAEGGVGLILASEKKAKELGRLGVRVLGAAVRTRPEGSFEVYAPSLNVKRGVSATVLASKAAFEMANLGPEDVDIAQLQDTESGAEIMHMAENGFCKDGDQEQMLADGDTRLDGRMPVNTDGGCMACGEPIGATGLRQIYENVIQLRGDAGERQVDNVNVAYSQVYGAPGLSGVCLLGK